MAWDGAGWRNASAQLRTRSVPVRRVGFDCCRVSPVLAVSRTHTHTPVYDGKPVPVPALVCVCVRDATFIKLYTHGADHAA